MSEKQAQPQERDIEALAGAMMDEAGLAPVDAWEAACIAVRRIRAQPSPREVALEKALRDIYARARARPWGSEICTICNDALASDGREG